MFYISLVALGHDGGIGSCLRLRLGARGSSEKRDLCSTKLVVSSWKIESLSGNSIELLKILKKKRINIACFQKTG